MHTSITSDFDNEIGHGHLDIELKVGRDQNDVTGIERRIE